MAQRRGSSTSVASAASTITVASSSGRTFPEKLMDMMQTSTNASLPTHSPSISWLPHGKAFVVTDPDAFARDVLPRYFKSTKFKSFTRKLYRWQFRQITKGPDSGSYYHELFQRDSPELCVRMSCHYSDKELRMQADNAAKRRGSLGSSVTAVLQKMQRHSIHGLPQRRGSFNLNEDDDDAVMAQINRAAEAFGGGGGGGTQFQQARRTSATRRTSYGSAVSGLSGMSGVLSGDDEDGGELGVPSSIHIGAGGVAALTGATAAAAGATVMTSSAVAAAAQAQARAQAAVQFSGTGSEGQSRTAEEILAQHRLEDAILAQQEAAIRARREQLQKEQESRLKALEIMAAAKFQGAMNAEAAARMKEMQEQMSRARAAQLQKEQEDRLKALEIMAAAKAGQSSGKGMLDAEAAARMKEVQKEMSANHLAMMRLQTSGQITATPPAPTALDILAAAGEKAAEAAAATTTATNTNTNTVSNANSSQSTVSASAAAPNGGASALEHQLLMDAMRKHQEIMAVEKSKQRQQR